MYSRWMRLLFGREFPFEDVLEMWDLLFAHGLRSDLVDFTCIAMLLRIRWQRKCLQRGRITVSNELH
jgi:TBC1 domain family protein 5